MKSSIAILMVLAATIGTASGATLFLSDVGFGGGATLGNPTLNMLSGDTANLYLYAQVGGTEGVNAIGIDILAEPNGVALGTSSVMENPSISISSRWNVNSDSGTPAALVDDIKLIAVTEFGLDGGLGPMIDPKYDASAQAFFVGTIGILADQVGTAQVFMQTNELLCIYKAGGPEINFGAGDAEVDPRTVGVRSALADATITVVPEPATMALLGIGGVFGLLRRRR